MHGAIRPVERSHLPPPVFDDYAANATPNFVAIQPPHGSGRLRSYLVRFSREGETKRVRSGMLGVSWHRGKCLTGRRPDHVELKFVLPAVSPGCVKIVKLLITCDEMRIM